MMAYKKFKSLIFLFSFVIVFSLTGCSGQDPGEHVVLASSQEQTGEMQIEQTESASREIPEGEDNVSNADAEPALEEAITTVETAASGKDNNNGASEHVESTVYGESANESGGTLSEPENINIQEGYGSGINYPEPDDEIEELADESSSSTAAETHTDETLSSPVIDTLTNESPSTTEVEESVDETPSTQEVEALSGEIPTTPEEEIPSDDSSSTPESEPVSTLPESGITILSQGASHHLSINDFMILSPRAFSAYPRGEQRNFKGIPIISILRHFDINYAQASFIIIHSYDGFATGITLNEAQEEGIAFIATHEDGEAFSARGGIWAAAPFMLVLPQDPFPNRFARYVTEISIE